jgi:chaperone modulatory protein CbpM
MITEREFLQRTHLDRGTLEIWIREAWIRPERTPPERTFTDMDLARANLIRDLKHNMGVNDEGLDVILHLIDQMHGLRRALAEALASLREREKGSSRAP